MCSTTGEIIKDLKINPHATSPKQPGFPAQLAGKCLTYPHPTHSTSHWQIVYTNGRDQGSIYMFLQLLRPCSHGPSFWSTQLPYLLLYRSSVLRHPTLLSRGMTGAKPLSLKTKPPHLSSVPRKANKLQNWTAHGPTGQRETCFECLNKQNTDC